MIATVFKLSWLNLKRDRLALVMTLLLPVVFFSVFVALFGNMDMGRANPIKTVLVVQEHTPLTQAFVGALTRHSELSIVERIDVDAGGTQSRARALALIRTAKASVVIVVPAGFGAAIVQGDTGTPRVEVLADTANLIALRAIDGLLQASAYAALGSTSLRAQTTATPSAGQAHSAAGPLAVRVVDVFGAGSKRPSISFFAAGIGVMFLLFSISGRSAILIDERENGVLARLLASQLSMNQLLVGHWLFLTVLGGLQVTVMFVWAALAFGLELWTARHFGGFALMTVASAIAAAAFGLMLAAVCRTRTQLTALAIVVVLIMSALGGTIVPRFLLPERIQELGLFTFNAWAVDGYQKVFWYEVPIWELWPQLTVLTVLALCFFAGARIMASQLARA